jgi:hypothetical protein
MLAWLPRVLADSSLGFLAGQYLNIYTTDCTDRHRLVLV